MNFLALIGLLIFFASLLSFSVILALKTKRRLVTAIISTLGASLIIQIVSYAHLGHFDPFYEIAFVTSVVIGFPISWMIAYLSLREN